MMDKIISALIFIVFIPQSCVHNKSLEGITNKFNSKKVLIVSCIQCRCINEELEKMYLNNKNIFSDYLLIGDTACLYGLDFRKAVKHTPQRVIDSIFPENFNLTIINNIKYPNRLIKVNTKDANSIKSFL